MLYGSCGFILLILKTDIPLCVEIYRKYTMEFLIYDHQCPVTKTDYFVEVVPWISVVLSLYITAQFLTKLLDTTFDAQIEQVEAKVTILSGENEELKQENEKLKEELEQQFEALKAVTRSFIINEHPLTKVD